MCERELETKQKLQYFDPHSYGRQHCVFLVLQMLAQRPTLLGDGFLYCILSATSLVPKLHRGSWGPPQPGVAFPTTSHPSPTLTGTRTGTSVLTELYNSSTPTRSWNGMIDRHPVEITVMQFRGHSLPVHQSMSVPWEFFLPRPISSANFRPIHSTKLMDELAVWHLPWQTNCVPYCLSN